MGQAATCEVDTETLSMFFGALSDPTRIQIVLRLLERGEMTVQEIAGALGKSLSLISHHLSCLRNCGIVKYRKEGKHAYYSLKHLHVADIIRLAIMHTAGNKESIWSCEVLARERRVNG